MRQTITPLPSEWDAFVSSHPRAHVLQQSAWGELKGAYGWQVERVALSDDGRIVAGAQLLFRRLPLHLGTMAYLGMGPLATDAASSAELWPTIDACARRHGAAFIKWEPGICTDDEVPPAPTALGFASSAQPVQPPRTVLIDITANEEAILARMNQGTRRKIRQSQKNGVRVWPGSRTDVAAFNQMMQTTGARNAFGVHEPGYYALAYDLFVPSGDAALILAEHEGDLLAGIMVFAKGQTAWYLYGASSDVKRNLMGAYAVQWAAVQWARARGCTTYDMWGIPDEEEETLEAQFEQRSDGLWGVYGFKRGWGGRVARSLGAWDKAYNPLIYAAYKLALRWRG
jgi:lipid II:glycine glycyltransferase (peptidoglycan interpeptide bridge formation enzyme)